MKRLVMLMIIGILLTGSVAYGSSPIEVQAETVKESEAKPWIKAYENKLKKLNKENEGYTYQLIYVNKDKIPELVVNDTTNYNCDVSLYTYGKGKVRTVMDHWMYGLAGALSYLYIPKNNVIYSDGSSGAGWEHYEAYMMMKNYKIVDKYKELLSSSTYDGKHFTYYYGDKKISKKKYESYQIKGKYEVIEGKYTYKQMMRKLKQMKG